MAQFVSKQWVPSKLNEVFPYFCDPKNFVAIMPPSIGARILRVEKVSATGADTALADAAGEGSLIEFSFRIVPLLPFRMKWLAKIVEFVPYSHFRDVQLRGPLKSWQHTHGFIAQERDSQDGTLITDRIEFTVGFSLVGALVDESVIRLALAQTFAHRRKVIKKVLAGGNA